MINKEKTKVLFAEVDSDFADVLLSFLTLPLGKIMRVLKKHYGEETPVIGSLTSLYNGLADLDSFYFWKDGCKEVVLNPRSSFDYECRKLKLDIGETHLDKYFCCENPDCVSPNMVGYINISMHSDNVDATCGLRSYREIDIRIDSSDVEDDGEDGVFTNEKESFLISDDLQMVPNMAGSFMQTLSNLGITDVDGAELRNVTFGFNEIMDLLRGSLLSRTPLTDIIILNKPPAAGKSEPGSLILEMEKLKASSNSKKMVLKVMVQKSTNKVLFAQSEEDFIDFLCNLLAVPLGGVEYLLGSKTCLESIDNLYRSIADINDKYLANEDVKRSLVKPKLPLSYSSENQMLPPSEQTAPQLFYNQNLVLDEEWLSYSNGDGDTDYTTSYSNGFVTDYPCVIQYENGDGYYLVKGPKMYMVSDDLTVTPLNMTSILSVLNAMKIPVSDVKEVEVHIGLQEALRILRASLTSTSA